MNLKLNLKVLNEMLEDFIRIEGSLLQVKDEATRVILFKQIQEMKGHVIALRNHYQKVLNG